jgi:uncharacterized protein (DUF2147 family)
MSKRLTVGVVGWALIQCMIISVPKAMAAPSVPSGVRLMGTKVAIQVFDCSGMLCGRVIWLKAPLDPQGLLKRDKLNPDPALRERHVCGPTIIWNARPIDPSHWKDGWFYNPDDGTTYRVTMELQSDDVMMTRIYEGFPIFGATRTLIRVPMGIGAGVRHQNNWDC